MKPFHKLPALLLSAVVLLATAWPVMWDRGRDSFPLSPYPMFSAVREQPWLDVIVGFDANGREIKIPPQFVANVEVMQAAQTIRLAVRRGRARQLCEQVAARIAAGDELSQVVELEVQRRQFEPRRYFVTPDGARPLDMRHKARCSVPRGRS